MGLKKKRHARTGKVTGDPPRIASGLTASQPKNERQRRPTIWASLFRLNQAAGKRRLKQRDRRRSSRSPRTQRRWLHASRRRTQAERQRQGPSHHASPAILLEPRLRQLPQIPARRIDGDRKIGIFPPLTAPVKTEILRDGGEVQPIEPCCRLSPGHRLEVCGVQQTPKDAMRNRGSYSSTAAMAAPSWCDDGRFLAPSGFATKLETALTPDATRPSIPKQH